MVGRQRGRAPEETRSEEPTQCQTTPRSPSSNAALPFVDRHIGLRPEDIDAMLETLGFDSLDALMDAAVPGGIRATAELDLPAGQTEDAVARELREIAAREQPG